MSDVSSDEDLAGLGQNNVDLASSKFAGTFHQMNEPPRNIFVPEYTSSVGQSSQECGRDLDSDGSHTGDIAGIAPTPVPPHTR